jgi:endonuclease G, mitochondrial
MRALPLIGLALAAACATAPRPPPSADEALIAENCGPLGHPIKKDHGPTHLVARRGYALEHSDRDRIPLWVCEHVTEEDLAPVPKYRRPKWRADLELPKDARAEDEDYTKSGWDRGHMAPSAGFGTKERRDETFFLSNAVPQERENNQGIWRALERAVRRWAKGRGELWVVTGAFVEGGAGVIGPNGVKVPTHLFKIVLARKDDRWDALAFLAENRPYPPPHDLSVLITSVDRIEEKSRLDFFPALDEEVERRESAPWSD